MLPYAIYLIKVIICSGILFGYYWLALRNKIYHSYNRFYLLAALLLSIILPLLQINILTYPSSEPQAIKILQVINGNGESLQDISSAHTSTFSTEQFLLFVYIIITTIFLCLFINVLIKIRLLLKWNSCKTLGDIYFINTTAKGTPFSFLKYIFWNDNIDIKTTTGNQIFKHEVVHIQQKHSYDKLFINTLLIFFWSNPFFWLTRKELNMIHEFIADKKAVEDGDTETFAVMILQAAYPLHHFQLVNHFFYSPIKRRLMMLTKNNNAKTNYIGRIMVLPLIVLVFAAFTLKIKTTNTSGINSYHGKTIIVVIDPGHGGTDIGAKSPSGNIFEKKITLSIAKEIKALNTNSDIDIMLTRDNDIDKSPQERAAFTKTENADLFISIHVDASTNDLASGMSVWVAKDNYTNTAKSKLFASAIINQFSKNYGLNVSPSPKQRQKGIWVLQEPTCPSIVIETGYLTNKEDFEYLQTGKAKETIAKNILTAINNYAFVKNDAARTSETKVIDPSLTTINIDTSHKHTTINLYNSLILINGKESDSVALKALDPNSIESMNVYKGKSAMDKFGNKGKNGVIVIELKKKRIGLQAQSKQQAILKNN